MRIAVIDDEKLTREELIRLIREDFPQAEVYEAGSGVQAMQLLEKKTFDFLFIDVRLGDMEGTTVASLARRLMPEARSSLPPPTPSTPSPPLSSRPTTTSLSPTTRPASDRFSVNMSSPTRSGATISESPSAAAGGTPSCSAWTTSPISSPRAPESGV